MKAEYLVACLVFLTAALLAIDLVDCLVDL